MDLSLLSKVVAFNYDCDWLEILPVGWLVHGLFLGCVFSSSAFSWYGDQRCFLCKYNVSQCTLKTIGNLPVVDNLTLLLSRFNRKTYEYHCLGNLPTIYEWMLCERLLRCETAIFRGSRTVAWFVCSMDQISAFSLLAICVLNMRTNKIKDPCGTGSRTGQPQSRTINANDVSTLRLSTPIPADALYFN